MINILIYARFIDSLMTSIFAVNSYTIFAKNGSFEVNFLQPQFSWEPVHLHAICLSRDCSAGGWVVGIGIIQFFVDFPILKNQLFYDKICVILNFIVFILQFTTQIMWCKSKIDKNWKKRVIYKNNWFKFDQKIFKKRLFQTIFKLLFCKAYSIHNSSQKKLIGEKCNFCVFPLGYFPII